MISRIYILNSKAEILAHENYNHADGIQNDTRYFDRLCKTGSSNNPVQVIQDSKYFYVKRSSLYFVAVSTNRSEDFDLQIIECLDSLYRVLKQFCGSISTDAVKSNFGLVNEVLHEIIDDGYIQVLSPEKLRLLIREEPNLPNKTPSFSFSSPDQSAEIFVDVLENMTVLVDREGRILKSNIEGEILVRNYAPGQSNIKLGLNENLLIGSDDGAYNIGVRVDECSFGESVNVERFHDERILGIVMKRGEMSAMKYRIEKLKTAPVRLLHNVSRIEDGRDVELWLKFLIDVPGDSALLNVNVHVPVPRTTTTSMHQFTLPDNVAEYLPNDGKVLWKMRRVAGSCEVAAKIRLVEAYRNEASILQLGPVVVDFEASNFVPSGMQIRFLNVVGSPNAPATKKWIRYVSLTDSYVFRLR